MEKHAVAFKRWGVLADWQNPYTTMDKRFEKRQLEIFWQLYQKGFIHRALMPIHWSPSSRTALAEAELEYEENHKSYALLTYVICILIQSLKH